MKKFVLAKMMVLETLRRDGCVDAAAKIGIDEEGLLSVLSCLAVGFDGNFPVKPEVIFKNSLLSALLRKAAASLRYVTASEALLVVESIMSCRALIDDLADSSEHLSHAFRYMDFIWWFFSAFGMLERRNLDNNDTKTFLLSMLGKLKNDPSAKEESLNIVIDAINGFVELNLGKEIPSSFDGTNKIYERRKKEYTDAKISFEMDRSKYIQSLSNVVAKLNVKQ